MEGGEEIKVNQDLIFKYLVEEILLTYEQILVSVDMGICGSKIVQETHYQHGNATAIDKTLPSNHHVVPRLASVYSQQGSKHTNQDTAILYQGFGSEEGILCGVFDGHGLNGHEVSTLVRNRLPAVILDQQDAFAYDDYGTNISNEAVSSNEWRRACVSAFKVMDKELKLQDNLDCSCSGSTATTIIIQGEDLIIANLGDSRAILGTVSSQDDELIVAQLTTDLKPDLPNEYERIKRCNGQIFALKDDPSSPRVWVPNGDYPGLAMSRAFGDLDVKKYGVIAVPLMTYHHLTDKDQFIVLATDGVWDVLTNDEVASIVWSVKSVETAAQAVVDTATEAWKQKFHSSKVDDCTVVCLFFQERQQAATTCPQMLDPSYSRSV